MSRIVSLFDKAAGTYSNPIVTGSIGALTRILSDEINRPEPKELFGQHPKDFDLYEIGIWDEATGKIEPVTPTFLVALSSLISSD